MTYEYACDSCGHTWEAEQRIVDPPLVDCPKCQKATAKRLISTGNFVLNGAGWFRDGYRSGG